MHAASYAQRMNMYYEGNCYKKSSAAGERVRFRARFLPQPAGLSAYYNNNIMLVIFYIEKLARYLTKF